MLAVAQKWAGPKPALALIPCAGPVCNKLNLFQGELQTDFGKMRPTTLENIDSLHGRDKVHPQLRSIARTVSVSKVGQNCFHLCDRHPGLAMFSSMR